MVPRHTACRFLWVSVCVAVGCTTDAAQAVDSGADAGSSSGTGPTSTGTTAPTVGGTETTTSAGSTSATTTSGATTTMGSSGSTGGSGDTGTTGSPAVLVDRGLVTRYYIDEAASGQPAISLVDVGPAPLLPLPLSYDGDPVQPNFFELAGNRGLRWIDTGQDGVAEETINGTKIFDLDNSTEGTIEVVMALADADSNGSRVSHIGNNDESGKFTLRSYGANDLTLSLNGGDVQTWLLDVTERRVMHLVLDTAQAMAADRARLYRDGVFVAPEGVGAVGLNAVIDVANGEEFALGNRANGSRSYDGDLMYAAMYSVALTPTELVNNVGILLVDDDTP